MDAGHYFHRRHMSLRYDEKNVNAQCKTCNQFNSGNPAGYRAGLVMRYGENVIEYLTMKKNTTAHFSETDYQGLIKEYRSKIKRIKIAMCG
jgi:hypothetical protein